MNINEIAKLAGVSRATVSRYLNNGYVSEQKRKIIKTVIEETGYQPSMQAQMLRTKKTRLIGVIIPKINSDTISRMVAGISMVLSEHNYQLLLANTNNNENEELKYLDILRENQVDGVILIGTIFTKKHMELLKNYSVPIVILGQKVKGFSCVYQDDYHAAKDLTCILCTTAEKLAYIGVTIRDEAAGKSRKMGYCDALKLAGKKYDESYIMEAEFSIESGYEKAKELFLLDASIDTLFCATDTIAIGAMMYIKEQKKIIPKQVQIAGIGDTQMTRIVTPKLTSVHFYYKTSGIEAAAMLMDFIESKEQIKKELKMGYELRIQESTRKK